MDGKKGNKGRVKQIKSRVIPPVGDIYNPSNGITEEIISEVPDLWRVSSEGDITTLRNNISEILTHARRARTNSLARYKKEKDSLYTEKLVPFKPSMMIDTCPSNVSADLVEVALDQMAWECFTCSNNEKGYLSCCNTCIKKCHSSHTVEVSENKLIACDCGTLLHNIEHQEDIESNPLNFPGLDGMTALFRAIHGGHSEMVEELLRMGAYINSINTNGLSGLHAACATGDIEMVTYLIRNGIHINQRDKSNHLAPIHIACKLGSIHIVEILLRSNASSDLVTKMGRTPLMIAAKLGSAKLVECLLRDSKRTIHRKNIEDCTAIDIAIQGCHLDCIVLLLLAGATISLTGSEHEVCKALIEEKGTEKGKILCDTLFRCACLLDDAVLLDNLIDILGFDIDERLLPYQGGDVELEGNIFQIQAHRSLPLTVSLTGVFIHLKSNLITSLFKRRVNIISPEDGLPYQLLQCNDLEVQYNWIQHYVTQGTLFTRNNSLKLSKCQIPKIPSIFVEGLKMYNTTSNRPVSHLELQDNLIDILPYQLAYVSELKEVAIEGNPLSSVNWKTKRDWPSLKDYLLSLESRASHWNTCRTLVLGDSETGRTSLVDSLHKKKRSSQSKISFYSHSISITRNVQLHRSKQKPRTFFHLWDFSTSELNKPTHKLFFSSRSCYIITFDLPSSFQQWEEGNYTFLHRIGYWLQLIRSHCESTMTPTLLVGTRLDVFHGTPADLDRFQKMIQSTFPRDLVFYFLKKILFISSKTGDGIEALKEELLSLSAAPGMLPMVPRSWVSLFDLIESLKNGSAKKTNYVTAEIEQSNERLGIHTKHTHFLTWEVYCNFATSCGVDHISKCTQFLCSIGAIFYFDECFTSALSSIVILDAQIISDNLDSLFTVKSSSLVHNYFLNEKEIHRCLKELPLSLHNYVSELLELLGIVYPIPNQLLFIPALLPTDVRYNAILPFWPLQCVNTFVERGRIFRFSVFPSDFLGPLFQSLLHISFIHILYLWKNGVIIQYKPKVNTVCEEGIPKQYGYLLFTEKLELCIRVRIPKAQRYGATLLDVLLQTVETQLERTLAPFRRYVPCLHCIEKRNEEFVPKFKRARCSELLGVNDGDGIYEFTFRECIESFLSGERVLWCNKIKATSRRVRVVDLAPDIAIANVPIIGNESLDMERKTLLGTGAFGEVHKIKLEVNGITKTEVAIKRIGVEGDHSVDSFLEFFQEVKVMALLSHPNVVNLKGITMIPCLQIVMEFVPGGDLFRLLHPGEKNLLLQTLPKISDDDFPWRERLMIVLDIARGMNQLHSRNPPILHRDLRSANIFVVKRSLEYGTVHAKVADFGLSRIVPYQLQQPLETWRWMAPEAFSKDSHYSLPADVYSFAIVCWEIATKCFPFDELYSNKQFSFVRSNLSRLLHEDKIKESIEKNGLRPSLELITLPANATEEDKEAKMFLTKLIKQCWLPNPKDRPTFIQICRRIKKALRISSDINTLRKSDADCEISADLMKKMSFSLPGQSTHEISKKLRLDESISFAIPGEEYTAALEVSSGSKFSKILGEFLWISSASGRIYLYSLYSMKLVQHWDAHSHAIICLLLLPHVTYGLCVWSFTKKKEIKVWHPNGTLVTDFRATKKLKSIRGASIVYLPSGIPQVWVYGPSLITKHSHIQILDVDTLDTFKELVGRKKQITALTQMPNQKVWAGYEDGHIRLYEAESLSFLDWAEAFKSEIVALSFIPPYGDNTVFQAWGSDTSGWVTIWNVKGKREISEIATSEVHISSQIPLLVPCRLHLSPVFSEYELFSDNDLADDSLCFTDWQDLQDSPRVEKQALEMNEDIMTFRLDSTPTASKSSLRSSLSEVEEEATEPFFFSGDCDGRIVLWDPSGVPTPIYEIAPDSPHCASIIAILSCKQRICIISREGVISIWYTHFE